MVNLVKRDFSLILPNSALIPLTFEFDIFHEEEDHASRTYEFVLSLFFHPLDPEYSESFHFQRVVLPHRPAQPDFYIVHRIMN
jgi:hypothetical protein